MGVSELIGPLAKDEPVAVETDKALRDWYQDTVPACKKEGEEAAPKKDDKKGWARRRNDETSWTRRLRVPVLCVPLRVSLSVVRALVHGCDRAMVLLERN